MALSATVQWDVRTTGNDANGGSFDPGVTSPGTDYSQQNSPQIAFTDLVIGGTNTTLTSSANPFTSAHVGNTINITSGSGFTDGRYSVLSVSGGVATMDRAVGTSSSTGGNGNLGGSMLTVGAAVNAIATLNTIWVHAGTYVVTATIVNTASADYAICGYSAAHGDNLPGAVITTSTNGIPLIQANNSTGFLWLHNLALSNTATTRADGIENNDLSLNLYVTNCTLTGFDRGIEWGSHTIVSVTVVNTAILNSVGAGIEMGDAILTLIDCFIYNSGTHGVQMQSGQIFVTRSVLSGNAGGSGLALSGGRGGVTCVLIDSTLSYNAQNGMDVGHGGVSTWITSPFSLLVQNCIFYGNTLWGVACNHPTIPLFANVFTNNNAYGGNASGNLQNLPAGVGDVSLSANPFTSHTTGDFSLNSAVGGGNSCKGVGYPGTFPGGLSVGKLDIGAVQSGGSSGGGAYVFMV
jgi:hypothetical protein